jgi:hypothetical protein
MKPTTFEDWKACITVACGIPLTREYVEQRLIALKDDKDYNTQKLKNMWGGEHYTNVVGWFGRALEEFSD